MKKSIVVEVASEALTGLAVLGLLSLTIVKANAEDFKLQVKRGQYQTTEYINVPERYNESGGINYRQEMVPGPWAPGNWIDVVNVGDRDVTIKKATFNNRCEGKSLNNFQFVTLIPVTLRMGDEIRIFFEKDCMNLVKFVIETDLGTWGTR